MGLETDREVMHYLNARRTFSRNRESLEEELEEYRTHLESILESLPQIRRFLSEEEKVVYNLQLEALQKRKEKMGNIGYAMLFYDQLQPLTEEQAELKENMGTLYINQICISKGIRRIMDEERRIMQTRLGCIAAHESEDETNKRIDKLVANFRDKSFITSIDSDYLDYYKKKIEYMRCGFAGVDPYEELFGSPEVHLPFYRGVSSFMLSLKCSIEDCERLVNNHLGKWNI
jgi:hypothetical protein